MYTLTITNFEGRSLKLEVATAAEAYGFKAKFEVLNLDIHVQDDSDLNKEGCYDGGFYTES